MDRAKLIDELYEAYDPHGECYVEDVADFIEEKFVEKKEFAEDLFAYQSIAQELLGVEWQREEVIAEIKRLKEVEMEYKRYVEYATADMGNYSLAELISKEKPKLMEDILRALARGYGTKETETLTVDATLCKAQAEEVYALFQEKPRERCKHWIDEQPCGASVEIVNNGVGCYVGTECQWAHEEK